MLPESSSEEGCVGGEVRPAFEINGARVSVFFRASEGADDG